MNGVNLHNESAYCESYEVHECMNDSIEIDQLILRIIFVYALSDEHYEHYEHYEHVLL